MSFRDFRLTNSGCSVYISHFVKMAMKMFAEGLSHQKGAIFGFGPKANDDTGIKLKISTANDETLQLLDGNVATHNLGEERNVGVTNYEVGISIRGNKNLSVASRKVVLNRSMNLIEGNSVEFKKFKKAANIVKEIHQELEEKMKQLETDCYTVKALFTQKAG